MLFNVVRLFGWLAPAVTLPGSPNTSPSALPRHLRPLGAAAELRGLAQAPGSAGGALPHGGPEGAARLRRCARRGRFLDGLC